MKRVVDMAAVAVDIAVAIAADTVVVDTELVAETLGELVATVVLAGAEQLKFVVALVVVVGLTEQVVVVNCVAGMVAQ